MPHSMFRTFNMPTENIDAKKMSQAIFDITEDLLVNYSSEIYKMYSSKDSKMALKGIILKLINEKRTGLPYDRDDIAKKILDSIYGYYPVQHLMDDKDVSDINISSVNDITYTKKGKTYPAGNIVFPSPEALEQFVRKSVSKNGGNITYQNPQFLGGDIKERMRIDASLPPFATTSAMIHFRMHKFIYTRLHELQAVYDMMDLRILYFLLLSIVARCKILVVGPPGSGKTTLTRAMINEISEKIPSATIEEVPEWYVTKRNNFPWTILTRISENDIKTGTYNLSSLSGIVQYSLTAGRICINIGEIKRGEAFDILDAYLTGNFGINTFHVYYIDEAHNRFAQMAAGNERARNYNTKKLEEMFAKCFDLVIFMDNFKIHTVSEVDYDAAMGVTYNTIYRLHEVKNGDRIDWYYKQENSTSKALKRKFDLTANDFKERYPEAGR